MGSTRFWLILIATQIIVLITLALLGPTTAATPVLKYAGWACLAGIFVCVPPLVIKLFLAGQRRIGNDALPTVQTIQQHQTGITVGVWAMIVAALLMALPRMRADLRAEQISAAGDVSATVASAASFPAQSATLIAAAAASSATASNDAMVAADDTTSVITPGAGSKTRTAILDVLRSRLKTKARFRVDHIRTYKRWAFVRATEVVELDKGELQETDLTISALLELPANSTIAGYRIVEMWTLPDDQQHPFADFLRGVRAKQKAEGLPAALFPGDM